MSSDLQPVAGHALELATERLLLRRFQAADLAAFAAYRGDPAVARYQSWDAGYSLSDAHEFFAADRLVAAGRQGGWTQLAIVERATGELCGDCAIHVLAEQPATVELGVTLAADRQGRGIAGEALGAVLDWCLQTRSLHRAIAHADDRNVAVQRLFERLGFRLEARLIEADWFKGEWATDRIYALLAREWPILAGR